MTTESEFEKWLNSFPRGEPELRNAYRKGVRDARDWILEKARANKFDVDNWNEAVMLKKLEELLK